MNFHKISMSIKKLKRELILLVVYIFPQWEFMMLSVDLIINYLEYSLNNRLKFKKNGNIGKYLIEFKQYLNHKIPITYPIPQT